MPVSNLSRTVQSLLPRIIAVGAVAMVCLMLTQCGPEQPGHNARPRQLTYEMLGPDLLAIRNSDDFDWTQVKVELFGQASSSVGTPPTNLSFQCPSPPTVRSGELLAVLYRACADSLPKGSRYATIGSVHVQASEGLLQQGFEPGLVILNDRGPGSSR
jgi:hypothetical protein